MIFLLITVTVSWSVWPLNLLNPDSAPFLPYGPTIAAIIITAVTGGRRELGDLLRRLVHWRVHPSWYATALLLPVALFGIPVLLMIAAGISVDVTEPFPWAMLPAMFAIRTIFAGPLGEELGWRGFLLPILRKRHGALAASLLIGLVWAPWHLPAMLSGPATDQRPLAQFFIWVLTASVLHTWMYERTGGSVLLVTLFHGALNTAASLLMPLFDGDHYATAWWLAAGAMTVSAAAVVWRQGDWTSPSAVPASPGSVARCPVLVGSAGASRRRGRHTKVAPDHGSRFVHGRRTDRLAAVIGLRPVLCRDATRSN
jgi:membrane protease YdiL (CAAX protease family)